MKNIRLASLLLLFTFTGCSDLLEENPESFISPVNFFKTGEDAEAAINAAYDALQSSNYYGRYWILSSSHASEATYSRGGDRKRLSEYVDAQIINSGRGSRPIWPALFDAINRANTVLDYVAGMNIDEDLKNRVLGEAHFLRGLHYLNLVRRFGPVPIIRESTKSPDIEALKVKRDPVEEVYDFVIAELTEANKLLPSILNYSGADIGRASKEAAQGLLVRAHWARAMSNAVKPEDWTKAAEWATGLLGKFSLEPDFATLWGAEGDNSPEVLFEVQWIREGGEGNYLYANYAPVNSGLGSSTYGTVHARWTFYSMFDDQDLRKDVTFLTGYTDPFGNYVNFWEITAAPAVHIEKHSDVGSKEFGLVTAPFNFPIIRYADILLMLAESLNEIDGDPGRAYQYINEVRFRANLPDLENLTQEQFRDSVFIERRRELCFEGLDFEDVTRVGKLKERAFASAYNNIDEFKAQIPASLMAELTEDDIQKMYNYQLKVSSIEWDDHNVLFPVPLNALQANPNLMGPNNNNGYGGL